MEVGSGAKNDRPELGAAIAFARQKDTLVVWKLDRLGRSLRHLIETMNELRTRRIGFRSLQENLDTSNASGKLFFHVFGALAEFERFDPGTNPCGSDGCPCPGPTWR